MQKPSLTIAWISTNVIQKIYDEVIDKVPYETGGCLIGYWGESFKEVVIEDYIGPGPNAKHYKNGFKPDSKWQEDRIANIYKESARLWTYLGDWHSHPDGSLKLSPKDKLTLSKIASCPDARAPYPIMTLISGPPWNIKIWKAEKARKMFSIIDAVECEIREF